MKHLTMKRLTASVLTTRVTLLAIVALGVLTAFPAAADRTDLFGFGNPTVAWVIKDPPDYNEALVQRMAEGGVTSTRLLASWREIEAEKGTYDWSSIDYWVDLCAEYGIHPYVLVVNTPGWARPDGKPSHYGPMLEAKPDWERFCTELAVRLKGKANHFEIWNEQNGWGWELPFNQVDKYLPWLVSAYDAMKKGNPDAKVSVGGLDNAAGNSPIFVRKLYDLKDELYPDRRIFDAISDHPYGTAETMRVKLRAIQEIAAAHGDPNVEMWLTEWGFHTGEMSRDEQARLVVEYYDALQEPEFSYVTMTNYLALSDMEPKNNGFGVVDINLRPKEAYYAMQEYPRDGKIGIARVHVTNIDSHTVEVNWVTNRQAQCTLHLASNQQDYREVGTTSIGTEHSLTMRGLKSASDYFYYITAKADGYPDAGSPIYWFGTIGNRLRNPGFEGSFDVQMARYWTCIGRNVCVNAPRMERDLPVHSGQKAQCIFAKGYKGERLKDDGVIQQVEVTAGKTYEFGIWTFALAGGENPGTIVRRVGIDPTGGTDVNSADIVWSVGQWEQREWQKLTVQAEADSDIITVFAIASTAKRTPDWDFFIVDDAELIEK